MAEVIGAIASAMTIAGLFKSCLDAFEVIQSARQVDSDLKKLSMRFNIERCKLFTWGEAMGLTGVNAAATERQHLLDSSPFKDLIKETLATILELFCDAKKLQDSYGCKEEGRYAIRPPQASTPKASHDPIDHLAGAFSNFKTPIDLALPPLASKGAMRKARWIIHDKKKFGALVMEVKTFIEGLQEITKPLFTVARQDGMMRYGVQKINNLETLETISAVCEGYYPELSDAASVKLDVLTIDTSKRKEIENWLADQSDGESSPILRNASAHPQYPSGEVNRKEPPPKGKSPNQIVIEYLRKSGFTDAEAVLRAEAGVEFTFSSKMDPTEIESSLEELRLLYREGSESQARSGGAISPEDADNPWMRVIREKNERIALLINEFDAHRADFRSTVDTLAMASSETERVYEKKLEELMQENEELQKESLRSERSLKEQDKKWRRLTDVLLQQYNSN